MAYVQYQVGLGSGARQSVRRKKKMSMGSLSAGLSEVEEAPPPPPPARKVWEFDRSKLSELRQIGEGNFGVVYLAKAEGLIPGEAVTEVAIKTLATEDEAAEQEFMSEVKVMKAVSKCGSIVQLLAVCTDKAPKYMIMEFMPKGDLKDVLKAARPKSSAPAPFGASKLAQMGAQIAEGMSYLGTLHIVHRDLAARNCLVGEDYRVKVGDFGLTRRTYASEYYRMKNSAPLPIRWMAIESLEDGLFTNATDLWAFGIVLWEIVSFGKLPYARMENFAVVDEVTENDYRMPAPSFCPAGFHTMMLQCWESEPEDRGTFDDKRATLLEMAARLSDEPTTRGEYRGTSPAAGDEDEDGEDEAPAPSASEDIRSEYDQMEVAAYEEPADLKARSGGAGGAGTVRTLYARPIIADADAVDSASIAAWIASTSGQSLDASDLHAGLMSGQVLCALANALKAGSVRKIHDKPKAIKQKQNIARALVAFETLGVPADDLFEVEDLFEDLDMFRVMLCLAELKKVTA